jgi:molybdopterin synthase catalytic subunit
MDYLKSSAPFWKRESGAGGSRWVEASAGDDVATARWSKTKPAAERARCIASPRSPRQGLSKSNPL